MTIDVVGIVVNERNYLENDKIITIFSNTGRLYSVKVAAGRKLKSVNRSKTQMFCYGSFVITEHSDKFSVLRSAEITNNYLELKMNFDNYYYALYFCELVCKLGYYHDLEESLFKQFILALNRLESSQENNTTKILFELIALEEAGLKPHFDSCVVCNNTNVVTLDYKSAGYICSNCFDFSHKKYELKTLAVIKKLSNVTFDQVGKIELSANVINEINYFIDKYIEYHLNIKLNTKDFIK